MSVKATIDSIIFEIENFNHHTANKMIEEVKSSNLYLNFNLNEKLYLFLYYLLINFFIQPVDVLQKSFNDMNSQEKALEIEEESKFYFLIIKLFFAYKNNNNPLVLQLIQEVQGLISSFSKDGSKFNFSPYNSLYFYYFYCSQFYNNQSDFENGFNYLDLAIETAKDHNNNYFVYLAYATYILNLNCDTQQSIFTKKSREFLEYFTNSDQKLFKALAFHHISKVFFRSTYLKKALELKKEALNIISNISLTTEGEIKWFADIHNSMGIYYWVIGKFDKAIEYFTKGLKYRKDDEGINGNLSELYFELGQYEKAFEYLNKSLEIYSKTPGNYYLFGEAYFQQVHIYLQLDNISEAENNFKKLKNLISIDTSDYQVKIRNKARFDTAHALMLLQQKTSKSFNEAQNILKSIVESNELEIEVKIDALFPLMDATIQEYKFFQNSETFEEIKELFHKLKIISENLMSIPLKIESLILQGKLEIVLGNYDKFEEAYNQAQALASEYELQNYEKWLKNELTTFRSEIQKWQNILEINTSLKQKLEAVALESYVKDVRKILNSELY